MYQEKMIPNELINQILTNNSLINSYQLELMLTQDTGKQQEINNKVQAIIQTSISAQKQLEEIGLTPEALTKYKHFKSLIPVSNKERDIMLSLLNTNQIEEAFTHYNTKLKPIRTEIIETLTDIKNINQTDAQHFNDDNKIEAEQSQLFFVILTIAAILICGWIGFAISKLVTKPIHHMEALMSQAKDGDLSVMGSYSSRDELGRLTASFNEMLDGLRTIIQRIRLSSENLSTSSEELSAGALETSTASEHVTAEIQEIADNSNLQLRAAQECVRTMVELSTGIMRIAESSSSVSSLSQFTTQQALEGTQKIERVSQQMNSILHTSQESATVIRQLEQHSAEIGSIVSIIKEISSQINLLSLNASIEAARAGESGRGFAVVAHEVKKLAEQSDQSSTQIAAIIEQIQSQTAAAVAVLERENQEVIAGQQGMNDASRSFQTILSSITEVSQQLEEISAASQQMSASSEEITASLHQVEGASQGSYTRSQNIAAASEQQLATMKDVEAAVHTLAVMAQELQEISTKFKL